MEKDTFGAKKSSKSNILVYLVPQNLTWTVPYSARFSTFQRTNTSKMSSKEGAKRSRRRRETYNIYIYKVLKQVHPEIGVSKKAMSILNSFVNDTFEKICTEASKLCKYGGKQTMSAREIQSSCKLVLPGELSKHALSEGTKALTKYSGSKWATSLHHNQNCLRAKQVFVNTTSIFS